MRNMKLAKFTKGILDFMFYSGILVCLTLPFSLKVIGRYIPNYETYYVPMMALLFLSGVFAVLIILELRNMFSTVLKEDCFVEENVRSSEKNGHLQLLHRGPKHRAPLSYAYHGDAGDYPGLCHRGPFQQGIGRGLRSGCQLQAGK